MYHEWFRHLQDENAQEAFKKKITSSKEVLERLDNILTEEEKNLDKNETTTKAFEDPNWAYKQAFYNGFRASNAFIKKLIRLDQQKETK